jgi:atypical dual specificity phosphatase
MTSEAIRPQNFSWIEEPRLGALARPGALEELRWLREQGIEVLLSLTEDPPNSVWIERVGLLLFHVPMIDMEAPTQEQLERCMSAIRRAHEQNFGVAVHCGAGLGRTGVVLACYLVEQGMEAQSAIDRVRHLRPGSVETEDQAKAIKEYARHRAGSAKNF